MNIQSTRIRLYGRVNGYLDTDKETQVPLTFSISDIKDISKRKGVFSKSITLPGTKNNNILLNNYFDVNVQAGTFNINKIVNCAIIQDGITILDNAILQLVSVNISQPSIMQGKITYTVLIKDTASDFFTIINNKFLSDLDVSDLDHIYTADNVLTSFNNTVNDGFKYVMPYNSPNLDIYGADATFDLIEFAPAIYAKTYFDKIFSGAGYTYNWPDALTKYRFDKLVIPYNGDIVKVEKEESSIYTATAGRTASATFSAVRGGISMSLFAPNQNDIKIGFKNTTTYQTIINNIEVSDPNNNYNPTTGIYSAPNLPSNQNDIKVEYTIEYDIIVNNPYAFTVYHVGFYNQSWPQQLSVSGGYAQIPNSAKREVKSLVRLMNSALSTTTPAFNNNISNTPVYINQKQSFASGVTILKSGTASFTNTIEGITPNAQIYFNTGFNFVDGNGTTGQIANSAVYNFYTTPNPTLDYGSGGSSTTPMTNVSISLRIRKMDVKFTCMLDGAVSYNIPLKMKKFIPSKIKQSDFVKALLTMFNLYVEVDKTNPTIINIIGRDDYYDSGVIKDWTDKLVKDQDQEIRFIPEITNKKLVLTYKQDKDWANERYLQATNEVYGQAEYTFDNEYVKDINKIELLFSPTPVSNTEFGAICPIWNGQAPKTNIRILYDGGEYTCGQYTIVNYRDSSGATGSFVTASTFPLITHWDKPFNPTFDLNFLPPDYYYRSDNWGSNTNNNLFNSFWRRTLNQMNNGKILTAYFYLNSYDIQKLRLNDKIRIDNSWWTINSIKDYDANSNKPTKVELISIDDSLEIPYLQNETIPISAGNPALQVLNDLAASKVRYTNTILSTGNIDVIGRDNYVGYSVNGKIYGNNNIVNSETTLIFGDSNVTTSQKTLVIGDGNTVDSDVTNALVIGSNVVATQSNTLYASNIIIEEGGSINNQPINNIVSLWEADTALNSVKQIVDTSGTNQATGLASLATGYNNISSGDYSATFNLNNSAQGNNSVAMGNSTFAQGVNSLSTGTNTIATGANSVSMGNGTIVLGDNSLAIGDTTQANGDNSLAVGSSTVADGNNSVAMGDTTNANGVTSFVAGTNNDVNSDYGSALGIENYAETYAETVIGSHAELVTGDGTLFDADDTVFRVGIGASPAARKDGFRVYKNGAVKLTPVTTASVTTPAQGMIIFDSSSNDIKIYNGGYWVQYIRKAIATTGTMIEFAIPIIYNSPTSPGTGNITDALTGSSIGIVQKIYHQQGTVPTFPAGWVLLRGTYNTSTLNIIYAEWVSGTRVEYWIIN